jgi:hypothetical protein
MAINLGARKSTLPKLVFSYPSWNWTPGRSKPVPYPVTYDLNVSVDVSDNVFYNKHNAFMKASHSANVIGDEAGKKGGVLSDTVSAEAEAIIYSESVKVNGRQAVRCGDLFYMNSKNTQGTLICVLPPLKGAITDSGKAPDAQPAPEVPAFMEFF